MAEVTSELIYEVLKSIQTRLDRVETSVRDVKHELNAMRGVMISVQSDTSNIYGMLARQDDRLDRIERRLDLRELAERPQSPYDAGGSA